MKEFKVGDRVTDTLINQSGVITEIPYKGWYLVLYDESPPFQYNCEQNPSLTISGFLELEKDST